MNSKVEMEFIVNILQVVIGVVIAYYFIKKFTGGKEKVFDSKFFKYFVGLLVAAVLFEIILKNVMTEPELVTQTVEQLQANPEIKRAIGNKKGYGYNKNEIQEIKKYPAIVKLSLFGSKADMELAVLVDSSANVFEVKEYKVKKLTKN